MFYLICPRKPHFLLFTSETQPKCHPTFAQVLQRTENKLIIYNFNKVILTGIIT